MSLKTANRVAFIQDRNHDVCPYGQTVEIAIDSCVDGNSKVILGRPHGNAFFDVFEKHSLYFSSDLIDELLEYGIHVQ